MTKAATTRRPPGAGRELVIRAARELFARKGYDGTSLRDIAEHAGVNESVIYRSVGTKDQIFTAAVLEPYHGFVTSFVDRWRAQAERRPTGEIVGGFVHELYDMLSEHRELISALVSANSLDDETYRASRAELNRELDALAEQSAADVEGRGMEGVDLDISVRLATGMVMSMVLLDDWLLPEGDARPPRARLLDEMHHFVLGGLERNLRR